MDYRNLEPREALDYIIESSCGSAASLVHYMTYMQSRAEQMVTASLQRLVLRGNDRLTGVYRGEGGATQLCVTFTTSPSQPLRQRGLRDEATELI